MLDTGTKAEIFSILSKNSINVRAISQSYDELNLSKVIVRNDLIKAIRVIHENLYEEFMGLN
ncbi:MAG: hypothetical protein ACFFEY_13305 [Candidatus Thorarchaeota archaeon]